ncbi:HCP-like protein [Rhizophagus irregularis]|uniref:HCP-like protein n=1 Tax=Rhizophagus irregularis TaxID=588596 RepID=A0A2I1GRI5_9GLOM|nr:HCP-like protein [Rhizophagus irregularis]
MIPLSSGKTLYHKKRMETCSKHTKHIHTVDLHYRNLESAKNLVIETIQEYHSTEIFRVRFITGRGNHINSSGERAILFKNFPSWMADVAISHLIESYEQGNGNYLVFLKSCHNDVPTVDLQLRRLPNAKIITIKTIQEFHSQEIFVIKFITGKTSIYKNFIKWISNITINHLIKFYVRYEGYYYVGLKSADHLESERIDSFLNVDLIKQKALMDDVEAQCVLGLMYLDGEGVKKDVQEALKWLVKSAENGNLDAQLLVGQLYIDGTGIGINIEKENVTAFDWFCMAAEQGDVNAQLLVGHMLYEGKSVTKNINEAFKWFEKAAKNNHVKAQFLIDRIRNDNSGINSSNNFGSNYSGSNSSNNSSSNSTNDSSNYSGDNFSRSEEICQNRKKKISLVR